MKDFFKLYFKIILILAALMTVAVLIMGIFATFPVTSGIVSFLLFIGLITALIFEEKQQTGSK